MLTRSRLRRHALDALDILSDRGSLFQPLLISDILALERMMDIRLAVDESFMPSASLGTYLHASAKAGRIDDGSNSLADAEMDLASFFEAPIAGQAKQAMSRQARKALGLKEEFKLSTFVDDYRLALA